MKVTGILLFIIGLALTIFTTVKFFTKEKVVDLGKIEITRNKPHSFSWSPIIGIAVMTAGVLILWKAKK